MENEESLNKPIDEQKKALSQEDLERMELLQRASETEGRQLRINLTTGGMQEIDELREALGKAFEDPEEKYRVYYKGIRKVLMDYLPKGDEFKEARDIIYDEKNVFLNRGKKKSDNNGVRGSDGRMTFQPVMNEMLDIIVRWVSESQNPFALYHMLYELNEKHGYGHEVYDKTTQSFANAMRRINEG